ncbi:MAG: hypothetical protein JNL57_02335 [Bacteroidetes bacterium]|nr:hypothetical protein [Bacteroidota bacterium]
MTLREDLIVKYERNMQLVFEIRSLYSDYLKSSNNGTKPAFTDSGITHQKFYDLFVRTTDVEYSQKQHEAIKTVPIDEKLLPQYIQGVDNQYANLLVLINALKKQTIY